MNLDENKQLFDLAVMQASSNEKIATTQKDINNLSNVVKQDIKDLQDRDDLIDAKINEVKTDLKIYKAMSGLIASIVAFLAWVIANVDNIKGLIR